MDEKALLDILTRPKNALVKQYQKLFDFEKVKLKFTKGAIVAIAREAIKRKAGPRGLRSIMETIMLDAMYDLPDSKQKKFVVDAEFAREQFSRLDTVNLKLAS